MVSISDQVALTAAELLERVAFELDAVAEKGKTAEKLSRAATEAFLQSMLARDCRTKAGDLRAIFGSQNPT